MRDSNGGFEGGIPPSWGDLSAAKARGGMAPLWGVEKLKKYKKFIGDTVCSTHIKSMAGCSKRHVQQGRRPFGARSVQVGT